MIGSVAIFVFGAALRVSLAQAPAEDDAAERALAAKELHDGKVEDAVARATRLVQRSENDPENRLLLARASLALADLRVSTDGVDDFVRSLWVDAAASASVAEGSAPLRDDAAVIRAFVKDREGDRDGALSIVESILARSPDHVDSLILRAHERMKQQQERKALTDLERALSLAPDRSDARILRAIARVSESPGVAADEFVAIAAAGLSDQDLPADCYQALAGHPPECVRALAALAESPKSSVDARGWLGRAQTDAGQAAAAVASFDRALSEGGSDSWRAYRADARAKVGELDSAIDDLGAVVAARLPERVWAMNKLYSVAAWCAEQGQFARMQRICGILVDAEPGNSDARANLALSQSKLDDADGAERTYRQAMSDFPEDFRLHNDLGLFFEGTGRADDAVAEFRLAADRGNVDALENLAILEAARGHRDAARSAFASVLSREPRRIRSILGLTRTYADPTSSRPR